MKDKNEKYKQLLLQTFGENPKTKEEIDDLIVAIMADAIRKYRRSMQKKN